jgi:hypothetical protein
MPSLLASLINNFLLLRDLFGYAIPGAVLLGIAGYFDVINYSKFSLASESSWLKATVVVTASYAVGHVLAALGYLPRDIRKFVKYYSDNKKNVKCFSDVKRIVIRLCTTSARDEREIRTLYYRYLYPSMFIEADRRETLTILRICLSVALLIAAWLPALPIFPCILFSVIGLFMLLNAYLSLCEANQYKNHAVSAAINAKAKDIPIFDWNGGNSSARQPRKT